MKFSIPESMASSCVSLLQWSWNYLHGNHFSGVQTQFLVLDRTMSNVVYIRVQKSLFPTHYFSAAFTECGVISAPAFLPLYSFSSSVPLQCHFSCSYFEVSTSLQYYPSDLHCLSIRGSVFCVISPLQAVPTQSVAHTELSPPAAWLVLPTQFTRKKCGVPLIILIPLCSKTSVFSSQWYSPDHPFSHSAFLGWFIGTYAFIPQL